MIMYIGFSTRTHKFIANIVCKHFKHCAPVIVHNNTCKIYQFSKPGQITVIHVKHRDLKILGRHGWKFVKYDIPNPTDINTHAITCVQFTKKFCKIHNMWIQTPDGLLKYLIHQ